MKKWIAFLTLIFTSFSSQAVTFEVLNPCTGRPQLQTTEILSSQPYPSVGHFTVAQLQKNRVAYKGNQVGISSIFNTPIGEQALDVVSSYQMFAYGWCFLVNGQQPEKMAHEVMIRQQNDRVQWFYGYSEYKNGQWLSMCEPAHKRPFKAFCR